VAMSRGLEEQNSLLAMEHEQHGGHGCLWLHPKQQLRSVVPGHCVSLPTSQALH
jgi:hypothetical protein